LFKMMELFETALEQEENDFSVLLQRYKEVFEDLLSSINTVKEEKQSSSKKKNIIGEKQLDTLLEKIVEKAKKRKALACKELSKELQGYAWPQKYEDLFDSIVILLKRYQFKEAIVAIEERK